MAKVSKEKKIEEELPEIEPEEEAAEETEEETEKKEEKQEGAIKKEVITKAINTNLMEVGFVKPREIISEMKTCYLDYAMSIIVARALPDVRDGLKPSQRRILYSMNNLGLNPSARYRKSALVVGDVLGKYHPHGDLAVYEALVRMAQNFSLRYPLVDGQGNFGSIDGDGAAAMRYTECRMAPIAAEILRDIDKEVVDFVDNYDASRKEPRVLPAAVPQLLINGAVGIAVGMATNIPPHNLSEVIDALTLLIDQPETEVAEIMQHIKGPDFPTGGFIYSKKDILEAYATGRGRMVTRAKCEIEEVKKERFNIIVSELTYQSNKAATITKIASLVKEGKLTGIRDLRDESDKDGIRVVIELKKDAFPKKVLNKLYQLTDLQKNFGLNMLALEGGIQPKVMNIKEVLVHYLNYREEIITRRTQYELKKAKERAHILEGLKKALDHIDEVIQVIKKSATRQEAKEQLMKRFKLTDIQTEAILEMRLQTLAGLERKKINDELEEKLKLIAQLEDLLSSKAKIYKVVKSELLAIKEKYGDERKTKVVATGIGEFAVEDLVPNEDTIITLSRGGYIKRINPNTYRVQHRGGVGIMGASIKEDDVISQIIALKTHDDVYFFSELGKVYVTKAFEIPEASRISKGQAIANFLSLQQRERITAVLSVRAGNEFKYFFMATKHGLVKRVAMEGFANIRRSGIVAIRLNAQDELNFVGLTTGKDEVILVTRMGQSIRFKESDARLMGRAAAGVRGIRLKVADDYVVGTNVVNSEDEKKELLVITERGYGKKTKIAYYKQQKRGGSGIRTLKVTSKNGPIAHVSLVGDLSPEHLEGGTDIIATSSFGNIIRIKIETIPSLNRSTQGVKIMKLREGDTLAQATKL